MTENEKGQAGVLGFWRTRTGLTALLSLLLVCLAVVQYSKGLETGDAGIKHVQMLDLVHQKFRTLACVYSGRDIDPEFRYLPLAHDSWFVYIKGGECYHYFPFYFAALIAPFYLLLGEPGEYLVPLLPAVGAIWLLLVWLTRLGLRDRLLKQALVLVVCGTGFSHAAVSLGEQSLATLLVTFALFLVWVGTEESRAPLVVLAAVPLAVATFFRQETALVAAAIPIALVIIQRRRGFVLGSLYSVLFLMIVASQLYINYSLLGLWLGGRSIQQASERASSAGLENLRMLFEILVYGRNSIGLFVALPLIVVPLLLWKQVREWSAALRVVGLSVVLFAVVLPFATVTYQGVNWGPRFLAAVMPVIVLLIFVQLELRERKAGEPSKLVRRFVLAGVVYSCIGAFAGHGIIFAANKAVRLSNDALSSFATDTVIYRTGFLYNASFSSHFTKKHFVVYKDEDFAPLVTKLKAAGTRTVTVVYASRFLTKDPEILPAAARSLLKPGEESKFKHFRMQKFEIR